MQPANVVTPGVGVSRRDPCAHVLRFRVRYSETDQMGTFYNSRPLEWFECGRTELFRALDLPYSTLESRGLFLPLVEAHVEYLGRARYDDLLEMTSVLSMPGRARLRCDVTVVQAEQGAGVVRGYTVHACADREGRAIRPPTWLRHGLLRALPEPTGFSSTSGKGTQV
jgi:acyl-CoA thioester hydrolase